MNENDLSDLVFKNKKEWGFQNKAHTCKKCTKATPASKKILVYKKDLIRKTLDERFTREDWKKKNLEEEEEEDFYSPARRRHTFSFLVRTKNEIVINERESNPQSSPSSVT